MPITTFYRFTCPVCQQSQDFYNSGNHEGWLTVAGEQFNSVACAATAYESVYGHAPAEAPPVDPAPVGTITPDPVPPPVIPDPPPPPPTPAVLTIDGLPPAPTPGHLSDPPPA